MSPASSLGVPCAFWRIGGIDPESYRRAAEAGQALAVAALAWLPR